MTQIAIVEDEPNIRDVVRLYLKRAGFSVIDFEDGQTALNAFNLQMPDLIRICATSYSQLWPATLQV